LSFCIVLRGFKARTIFSTSVFLRSVQVKLTYCSFEFFKSRKTFTFLEFFIRSPKLVFTNIIVSRLVHSLKNSLRKNANSLVVPRRPRNTTLFIASANLLDFSTRNTISASYLPSPIYKTLFSSEISSLNFILLPLDKMRFFRARNCPLRITSSKKRYISMNISLKNLSEA